MIRLLIAAGVAMSTSLIGTRVLIRWLSRLRIGQPIRNDGPEGHATKAGTPTMGGVLIIVSQVLVFPALGRAFGMLQILRVGMLCSAVLTPSDPPSAAFPPSE